jgi:hypothetical protein
VVGGKPHQAHASGRDRCFHCEVWPQRKSDLGRKHRRRRERSAEEAAVADRSDSRRRFINRVGIETEILGEYVNGIATDSSGNIFVGGAYLGTVDLDPTRGVDLVAPNPKYGQFYQAYLLKLGSDGKLIWADAFGGQFDDVVNAVAVDPSGNPIITGYFTRRADLIRRPRASS